jgi:hypothetical protein
MSKPREEPTAEELGFYLRTALTYAEISLGDGHEPSVLPRCL